MAKLTGLGNTEAVLHCGTRAIVGEADLTGTVEVQAASAEALLRGMARAAELALFDLKMLRAQAGELVKLVEGGVVSVDDIPETLTQVMMLMGQGSLRSLAAGAGMEAMSEEQAVDIEAELDEIIKQAFGE